ncbi:glutamate racemase [Psychrilyobacter atlanticus]|uniref:glutamate racemase n=1 Tax=Psychrilyobacter atlanticus TaxID=271091 RepID=UPI00041E5C81|nr:glutamate racemase [Psychrilyobacter atlanticus]
MYKIGIFDSGVGGLTVLKEIQNIVPSSHILYYGDNGNAPYGDKTEIEIKELCLKIGEFLYENEVDIIVIACNTATAASIKAMKNKFPIPVIGVIEPGIRAALEVTQNKNIGVILTPASAKMGAYKNVFDVVAPKTISLTEKGCKLICPMIENGWEDHYGSYLTDEIIKLYIEQVSPEIDTLILGCTHYPIVERNIAKYFKKNIVNPANETANELLKKLSMIKSKKQDNIDAKIEFIVSGDSKKFLDFAEKFLGEKIDNIYELDLHKEYKGLLYNAV